MHRSDILAAAGSRSISAVCSVLSPASCASCPFVVKMGLLALALLPVFGQADAAEPWWSRRGLMTVTTDDYKLINQGQAKNLATAAFFELAAGVPGGAGVDLEALIADWQTPPGTTDDYTTLNIGQVKNLARQFYLRLTAVGYAYPSPPLASGQAFPWTVTTADDDDYYYANLGQLKNAFSFDVTLDTDSDGLPDWWEDAHGMNKNSAADAALDPDTDGLTNLAEYQRGTNPAVADPAETPHTGIVNVPPPGSNPSDTTPPVIVILTP